MILRFPTGLYSKIIPKIPSDSGNVTFTISNQDPPRSSLLFPKISRGIAEQQYNPIHVSTPNRRRTVGELIFTVSKAGQAITSSSAMQYEVGQTLEFTDQIVDSVDPMLVGDTEIRHNLFSVDYDSLEISAGDQSNIVDESVVVYRLLMTRLNNIKQSRADADAIITQYQKDLNEANRTIGALNIIIENSPSTAGAIISVVESLTTKVGIITNNLTLTLSLANDLAAEAADVVNKLKTLAMVVR